MGVFCRTAFGFGLAFGLSATPPAVASDGSVEYVRVVSENGRKHSLPTSEPARLVEVSSTEALIAGRRVVGYRWTVRDVPGTAAVPGKPAADPRAFTFGVGRELPVRLRRGNVPVRIDPRMVKAGTRLAVVLGRGEVRDAEGRFGPAVEKVFTEEFFRSRTPEPPKPVRKR